MFDEENLIYLYIYLALRPRTLTQITPIFFAKFTFFPRYLAKHFKSLFCRSMLLSNMPACYPRRKYKSKLGMGGGVFP